MYKDNRSIYSLIALGWLLWYFDKSYLKVQGGRIKIFAKGGRKIVLVRC